MDKCFNCGVELLSDNWYASYQRINKHQCKLCARAYTKRWEKTHKDIVLERRRKSSKESYQRTGGRAVKANALRLRLEVIKVYGGKCACCGDSHWEFLEIDHKNGGGNAHRRALGVNGGYQFYLWLRKQGFPSDEFQLLCSNCNQAKRRYGRCPHENEPTAGF